MLTEFFRGELGTEALGQQAAAVLTTVDGCGYFANEAKCPLTQQKMPMPVFQCCPGPFLPIGQVQFMTPVLSTELCNLTGPRWSFVERFASLGALVQSPQHYVRFQYWNDSFAYWRSIAALECQWEEYEHMATQVRNLTTESERYAAASKHLLPLRVGLVQRASATMTHQLQLLSDPGDLGVLTNIVSESILASQVPGGYPAVPDGPSGMLLGRHARELSEWLGGPSGSNATLPSDAMPQPGYAGRARVFVPTVRTLAEPGETMQIEVTVLAEPIDRVQVTMRQRPMGQTTQTPKNTTMKQAMSGRGVFRADLGVLTEDTEWMVEVLLPAATVSTMPRGRGAADGEVNAGGHLLFAPPGAPDHWQSIVVLKT